MAEIHPDNCGCSECVLDGWVNQSTKLKAENAELRRVIKGALEIKALWEPAKNMENIDEGKALLKMAEQFEQALKT